MSNNIRGGTVSTKRTQGVLAIVLAATAGAFLPVRTAVLEYPCRAGSDTATLALNVVKSGLAASDSAGSLAPQDVNASLVTDSVTCQAIVNSYNAARVGADSLLRVTSGFVVRAVIPSADTAYAMYLPATPGPPARTQEVAHFDKAFQLLLIQAGLN